MQFVDNDPSFKIVRNTGPQHNLLGMRFSKVPLAGAIKIEVLNADTAKTGELAPEDVLEQVLKGVEQVSKETGRQFFIEAIQCITTDSPPVSTYEQLAVELIRRMEQRK